MTDQQESDEPHPIFSSLASMETSIPSGGMPEPVAVETARAGDAAQWEKRYGRESRDEGDASAAAAQDLLFLSTSSQMSSMSSLSDSIEMFLPPIFGFSPGKREDTAVSNGHHTTHSRPCLACHVSGHAADAGGTPRSSASAESAASGVSGLSQISCVAALVRESSDLLTKLPEAQAQRLVSSALEAESPVVSALARKIAKAADGQLRAARKTDEPLESDRACGEAHGSEVLNHEIGPAVPPATWQGHTHQCPGCQASFSEWTSCRSHLVFSDCLADEKAAWSTMEALEALERRCALHLPESSAPQHRGSPAPAAQRSSLTRVHAPVRVCSSGCGVALDGGGGGGLRGESKQETREVTRGAVPGSGDRVRGNEPFDPSECGTQGGGGGGGDGGGGGGGAGDGGVGAGAGDGKKYRCPECGDRFYEWDACRSHIVFSGEWLSGWVSE